MARLADSLKNLFAEIDAVWPQRDRRTDGWIGDKAHQATQSDHNPDSRGIVHAIDIDKDGIDAYFVVEQCIRDDRPASYVVYNREIWSRSRDWKPRRYTGSNPHTSHIHVSIQYGPHWESPNWTWGIATGGEGGFLGSISVADDMSNWENVFTETASAFEGIGGTFGGGADIMRYLMGQRG